MLTTAVGVHRMLLRLERITISAEDLARPIPSLSERQFVVAKAERSAEDERRTRELFWYREELLRHVTATWNEVREGQGSWYEA